VKTLRRTCAATILSLILAMSVLAGQIEAPGVATPPTNPTPSITATIILIVVSVVYR